MSVILLDNDIELERCIFQNMLSKKKEQSKTVDSCNHEAFTSQLVAHFVQWLIKHCQSGCLSQLVETETTTELKHTVCMPTNQNPPLILCRSHFLLKLAVILLSLICSIHSRCPHWCKKHILSSLMPC